MASMEQIKKKTVIVTGGTRGIGKAISLKLAHQQYNLVLNYLADDISAEKTFMECRQIHPDVMLFKANVADKASVEALMRKTLTAFHSIDVLINNAGQNRDHPLHEMSEEDWDHVVDTNMKSVFLCSQLASLQMLQQKDGGSILNIGAPTAIRGRKNGINYCASKAGVLIMTKCLALELAPKIRVNCVIPGSIWTEETEKRYSYHDPVHRKEKEQSIPLKRIGTPEEVADVVAFLLSQEARYITGQKMIVDGGQDMW